MRNLISSNEDVKGTSSDFSFFDSFPLLSTILNSPLRFISVYGLFCLYVLIVQPAGIFTIDEALYVNMAHAMANHGVLYIGDATNIDGSPAITMLLTTPSLEGARTYPQYPGGYALMAAPFYMALGPKGLIFMNMVGGGFALLFTYKLAEKFTNQKNTARDAMLIFGTATFFLNYAIGIWPHMVTLSILLAGTFVAIGAIEKANHRQRLIHFAAAGFLFGLSLSCRVDGVFIIAALFFWMRFFGAPQDRLGAAVFLAGVIPHLIFGAILNNIKYGVFLPFSYGPMGDSNSFDAYAPLAIIGIMMVALSFAINVNTPFFKRIGTTYQQQLWISLCAGLVVTVFILALKKPLTLSGLFALTIDLQAINASSSSITVVDHGYKTTFGEVKKALAQSLPFMALLTLPMIDFFRGKNTRFYALSFMIIAAPITFYGFKHWHGGFSLNMRYFLPCVPFIAILSAIALRQLMLKGNINEKHLLFASALGFVTIAVAKPLLLSAFPTHWVAIGVYPQLLACTVLLSTVVLFIFGVEKIKSSRAAALIAAFSIGLSIYGNYGDHARSNLISAIKGNVDRAHRDAFAPGSLVITTSEDGFALTRAAGVHVMRAFSDHLPNREKLHQAATAFNQAGHCVYIHSDAARDRFGTLTGFEFSPSPIKNLDEGEGYMIYTLSKSLRKCTLS